MRSEHVVLVAGFAVIGFAVLQLDRGRSADWWLWGTGLAFVALGLFRQQLRNMKLSPSGIELAIEASRTSPAAQFAAPTQPPDLKLLISTGIPVGAAETYMGTDHIIQVSAVNTGERPLGVSSLGLSLTNGKYIPMLETMPTTDNVRLPAILKPQQTATMWLRYDHTQQALAEMGVGIDAILAHLVDGTTRRERVPDDWRDLGKAA